MAQETLVNPDVVAAQMLTKALDKRGLAPRAVLWVKASESSTWRLWVVPSVQQRDKREFYASVVNAISEDEIKSLESGDVLMVDADHPAIKGLSLFIRADGVGSIHMSSNIVNGFYLPDAVVVRMALN